MSSKVVRIVIWGSVAVAVVVVLYIRYARMKVPGLVSAAQKLVEEGDAKVNALGKEANQLMTGLVPREFYVETDKDKPAGKIAFVNGVVNRKGFDVDWAKLEASVAKADQSLAKIVECYRAAAAKFDEGRQASKSEVVSNYLDLMSQAYQKRADAEEARRKALAVLVDKSIQSEEERRKKFVDLMTDSRNTDSQFQARDAEARKLHEDNGSEFNRAGLSAALD